MNKSGYQSIEFEGKKIYFRVGFDCSEYGDSEWTDFYLTRNKTRLRKKYYLFGPMIKVPDNKIAFTLHGEDFTSTHRTKEQNRKFLRRQLELLGRPGEIEKREFV